MSRRITMLSAVLTAASLMSSVHAAPPLWTWESGTQEGWGSTAEIDVNWTTNPVWTDKARTSFGATDGNVAYAFKTPATAGFGFDECTLLQASNITGIDPTQALRWDTFKANNLYFADITVAGERTAPLDPANAHFSGFYPAFNGPSQAGGFIDSYNNPSDGETGASGQYQIAFSTEYYVGPRTRTLTWDYANAGYNFNALTPTDTDQNYTFLLWANNNNHAAQVQAAIDNIRLYRARATDPTWTGGASGTWTAAGSWANGSPNAVGAIGVLKYTGGLPAVAISLDSSKTVGSLIINGAARNPLGTPIGNASGNPFPTPTIYTINAVGGATLTVDNGTAEGSIVATTAGNAINAPVNFNSNAVIDLTADVRTGNQDGVPSLTGASLAINGNVSIAAAKMLRTTSVGALTLNGNVIGGAGSALHIGGGTTALSGTGHRIAVSDLGVATSAQLDIGTGSATVDYTGTTPFANLYGAVVSGYAAGAQNGKGIVTSAAGRTVGIIEASSVTLPGNLFLGQTVDATTVLIRSTYAGDFDLSGLVEFADLVVLAQNYQGGTSFVWRQGDTNFDGQVNFADLVSLAQNYQKPLTLEELGALGSDVAADWALAQSLVPEPTTLVCLAGVSALTLRRRRDR
jgi:hypothetical protein